MSLIPILWNRNFDDMFDFDPWNPWGQHGQRRPRQRQQKPDKWTYGLSIGEFDPANVKVKVEDDKIFVHARQVDGNTEWGDTVEKKRVVKVPENVDTEHVHSYMRPDGTLILEAPFREPKDQQLQVIPHEGGALAPMQGHGNLMVFSVGKCKPEEVKITCKDGVLTAQGEHSRTEDGCEIRESFFRQLTVPKAVDDSKIQCFKDDDGNLTIRAPTSDELDVEMVSKK